MTPVEETERALLPLCESAKERLAKAFPAAKFTVFSCPIGSATDYQGHLLGIDVLLPDRPREEADNLALVVGLKHLTTDPMLHDAGVSWGAGDSPDIQCELFDEAVPFSSEVVSRVVDSFPILVDTLQKAVEAGLRRSPA